MRTHGYGYDVMFPHPVSLGNSKNYQIKSILKGLPSLRGADAVTSVKSAGVAMQKAAVLFLLTSITSFLP